MTPDNLKERLRSALRNIGWEVRRYPNYHDPSLRRHSLFKANAVDLVIDVGANTGQYASELREYGYENRIISLEPMREAFEVLQRNSKADDAWQAINAAAGTGSGTLTINLSGNSISSSALPMLERHARVSPQSIYEGKEVVQVDTLDSLLANRIQGANGIALKIDTQGFEADVLDGAAELLPKVSIAEIELSFVPLYEGQHLWWDLVAQMKSAGFEVVGLTPGLWDRSTGEMLQADGLFINPTHNR
jgi:FkbM family methyltransferase